MVEDFGKGTLSGGATVTLDVEFREVAETGDYHVFLTPGDGVGALRYARQTATSFSVEEIGGTPGGSFAWRVVAKPKDGGGKVQRLAKYEQPNIKIPGINDLPKDPSAIAKIEKPAVAASIVMPPVPEVKPANGSSRSDSPPAPPNPVPAPRTAPATAAPAVPAASAVAPANAPAPPAPPPAPLPPSR